MTQFLDSPLTDDSFHGSTSRDTGDECHDNTRRAEADGYGDNTKETGKRKQKKMYTAKNDRVFSDTPFKPTTSSLFSIFDFFQQCQWVDGYHQVIQTRN